MLQAEFPVRVKDCILIIQETVSSTMLACFLKAQGKKNLKLNHIYAYSVRNIA